MMLDASQYVERHDAALKRAHAAEEQVAALTREVEGLRDALEASRVSITYAIEALRGGLADSDREYLVNVLVSDEQAARSALAAAAAARGTR
jgi:hypothetical protein